ncbi:MAG: hypothetical protein FJX57_11755 [Alphaproteobacteria bacterium]|nr:hypothetical protein [Alphaproteobacteria bacterium]
MTFDPAKLILLVVDPRAESRLALRGLAERIGIGMVRLAADMTEALERLRDEQVTAMLIDDGAGPAALDLLRALRRRTRGRIQETPVILVASADAGAIKAARDAGVSELMAHPPSALILRERIEEIVLRPRRFIRSTEYVGPCRRRRRGAGPEGSERRDPVRPASVTPSRAASSR